MQQLLGQIVTHILMEFLRHGQSDSMYLFSKPSVEIIKKIGYVRK